MKMNNAQTGKTYSNFYSKPQQIRISKTNAKSIYPLVFCVNSECLEKDNSIKILTAKARVIVLRGHGDTLTVMKQGKLTALWQTSLQ